MKHITNFIIESAQGRGRHNSLVKPCNNLIDEFNKIINNRKAENSARTGVLIVITSGASAGESIINDFINVARKNKIDSFTFSSASDKLVKITDAHDINHQGPHVHMDDVLNALLDEDIDTYDFSTVYILSDGLHNDSSKTAGLVKELIDEGATIYGFSFGQEEYEMTCKIVGDGADYKNALSGYFFNK